MIPRTSRAPQRAARTAGAIEGRASSGTWFAAALAACLIAAVTPAPASAQVVQVQAGSSSLFDAHGGSVELRGASTSVTLAAGQLGGSFTTGLVVRRTLGSFVLSGGDQVVDFDLATDVFGGSRYVPLRGAGMERRTRTSRLVVLGGATSTVTGAPFFRGGTWDRATGLVFYDQAIGGRTRLFTRNSFGHRTTSITGIAVQPAEGLTLGASGGVGQNHPYAAASLVFERRPLSVTANLVSQRPGFRRVLLDSPMASEPQHENVAITYRPSSRWSVNGLRRTFLETPDGGESFVLTLNQLGASVNLGGFRLVGAAYQSVAPDRENLGVSASIGRRLSRSLDLSADYFRNDPSNAGPSDSVVLRLQETISPRLTIMQAATHANGQTSLNVGGEFLSNPLRLTVTYQTVYAPLHPVNPFVQVVGVDGRLQLTDALTLRIGTYTTPSGRPRYTVSGSFFHGGAGGSSRLRAPRRIPPYLVRGRVELENGTPVAGAVIRLGDEVISTNSEGRFFARAGGRSRLRVDVLPEEFSAPGRYEVVEAPGIVEARAEADAAEFVIVVRRY